MVGGLGDIWKVPELRKRIFFTIAMLAVYRLGVFVSTPGINVARLRQMFEAQGGTLLGLINMFSGAAHCWIDSRLFCYARLHSAMELQ